eukprot:m.151643 g.151643  ORF g.151643 m.151643 type:complete len:176 (+) comp14301_c0_seq4:4499-5026(+)
MQALPLLNRHSDFPVRNPLTQVVSALWLQPAPPSFWYDQMGAWEVQNGTDRSGKIIRQASPVWPACWSDSCTGPFTYFGPAQFNATNNGNLTIDIKLEDYSCWTFGGASSSTISGGITLCSYGTAVIMHQGETKEAKTNFAVEKWHTCSLRICASGVTAILNDVVVGTLNADMKN